jgi:hypothetical protein
VITVAGVGFSARSDICASFEVGNLPVQTQEYVNHTPPPQLNAKRTGELACFKVGRQQRAVR